MRITKADAESVASKMTEKKEKEIQNLSKKLSELAYKEAVIQIPVPVMKMFKEKTEWFTGTTEANISGPGLQNLYVKLKASVPQKNDNYRFHMTVDAKTANEFNKLVNDINDLRKELNKLHSDIQNALLSLGTYAKVQDQFKEAAPFLPFKQKSEIVVNLNDIRKRI